MSWNDMTFTFPFTIQTLVVAITAYSASAPLLTTKFKRTTQYMIWLALAVVFTFGFTLGYGLRFLLGIVIMMASRMRLVQTGFFKEILMLIVTLVTAMLFVGLR